MNNVLYVLLIVVLLAGIIIGFTKDIIRISKRDPQDQQESRIREDQF